MENIDLTAFGFINLITAFIGPLGKPTAVNIRGDGAKVIADLGEVQNLALSVRNPNTGELVARYKDVGGRQMGLESDGYKQFQDFLKQVINSNLFSGKCDYEFVEKHSFAWLMDVYESGKAVQGFETFLLDRISDETKPYTFNLKMAGFSIEDDISLGAVVISAMDEKEAKQYWTKVVAKYDDESKTSDSQHSSFEGLTATVRISATFEQAKQLALYKAELAIDVLKCFCAEYSLNPEWAIPDLSYRTNGLSQLNYWVYSENAILDPLIKIENRSGTLPIQLDNAFVQRANERGLAHFVRLISQNNSDDLYVEIVSCIQRFADLVSTYNQHEKLVKAIALLEGPISPRPSTGKNQGESRIKNSVIPKLNLVEAEKLKAAIRYAYDVRNAYVHNGQFRTIEIANSRLVFEVVRMFIVRLIQLHGEGKRQFSDIGTFFGI